MNTAELRAELKQLYSIIECPSDDWYDPEIIERIEEIKALLKKHETRPLDK